MAYHLPAKQQAAHFNPGHPHICIAFKAINSNGNDIPMASAPLPPHEEAFLFQGEGGLAHLFKLLLEPWPVLAWWFQCSHCSGRHLHLLHSRMREARHFFKCGEDARYLFAKMTFCKGFSITTFLQRPRWTHSLFSKVVKGGQMPDMAQQLLAEDKNRCKNEMLVCW